MARTPLLRALRQLAGEHAAAEQLGVPVEELRARRDEHAYSRKDFLKRTGAVGVALAAAGPAGALVRTARGATAPRIAIVGGGIAGLTTALTLQDKGIASTVYEAHPSRIGGRMHSDFDRLPGLLGQRPGSRALRRADRHGAQDDPRTRAARFNLPTVDLLGAEPNGSTDTVLLLRRLLPRRTQADRDFKAIRAALHRDLSAASYPTHLQDLDGRAGIALDQHEHLRLDRVPRARRPLARRSASCSTSPTTSSTAPRRPISRALNLVYLLGY